MMLACCSSAVYINYLLDNFTFCPNSEVFIKARITIFGMEQPANGASELLLKFSCSESGLCKFLVFLESLSFFVRCTFGYSQNQRICKCIAFLLYQVHWFKILLVLQLEQCESSISTFYHWYSEPKHEKLVGGVAGWPTWLTSPHALKN